jgi:hypothetical protein
MDESPKDTTVEEPTRIPLLPAEQQALRTLSAAQQCPDVLDVSALCRKLSTLVIQNAGDRSGTLLSGCEIELLPDALVVRKP